MNINRNVKKLFSLSLIFLMLFIPSVDLATSVKIGTSMSEKVYNGIKYVEENDEITLTGYEGKVPEKLVLPDKINGKKVTKIKENAFNGGSSFSGGNIEGNIKELVLPKWIKLIGERSFIYNDIETLDFSNIESNYIIEDQAFASTNLSKLKISKNAKSIKSNAFNGNELEEVYMDVNPEVIKIIDKEELLFKDNSKNNKTIIPKVYVDKKYKDEFEEKIIGIINPAQLKIVESDGTYKIYTGLEKYKLEETDPFNEVELKKTNTNKLIEDYILMDIEGHIVQNILKNKDNLDKIRQNFFQIDHSYKINISNKEYNIKFNNKTEILELAEDNIDKEPVSPEESLFKYEDDEEGITITGYKESTPSKIIIPDKINNKPVIRIGKNAFQASKFGTGNKASIEQLELPEGLKEISERAFFNQEYIKELKLPNSLEKIGERAFENCSIKSLTIPENVSEIDSFAFKSNNISEFKIKDSHKDLEIGRYVLSNNQLNEFFIPDRVTRLGDDNYGILNQNKDARGSNIFPKVITNNKLANIKNVGGIINPSEVTIKYMKDGKEIKKADKVVGVSNKKIIKESYNSIKVSDGNGSYIKDYLLDRSIIGGTVNDLKYLKEIENNYYQVGKEYIFKAPEINGIKAKDVVAKLDKPKETIIFNYDEDEEDEELDIKIDLKGSNNNTIVSGGKQIIGIDLYNKSGEKEKSKISDYDISCSPNLIKYSYLDIFEVEEVKVKTEVDFKVTLKSNPKVSKTIKIILLPKSNNKPYKIEYNILGLDENNEIEAGETLSIDAYVINEDLKILENEDYVIEFNNNKIIEQLGNNKYKIKEVNEEEKLTLSIYSKSDNTVKEVIDIIVKPKMSDKLIPSRIKLKLSNLSKNNEIVSGEKTVATVDVYNKYGDKLSKEKVYFSSNNEKVLKQTVIEDTFYAEEVLKPTKVTIKAELLSNNNISDSIEITVLPKEDLDNENDSIFKFDKKNYTIIGFKDDIKTEEIPEVLEIPDKIGDHPVKKIGAKAFNNKKAIKSIKFSNNLEEIGSEAFRNCNIKDISIPGNVKIIGKDAFRNAGIMNLELKKGIEELKDGAFAANSITEVIIPDTVKIWPEKHPLFSSNRKDLKNWNLYKFVKVYNNSGATIENTFGIVNPTEITIRYEDKDGNKLKKDEKVVGIENYEAYKIGQSWNDPVEVRDGSKEYLKGYETKFHNQDLENILNKIESNYYQIGKTYTFKAPEIGNYLKPKNQDIKIKESKEEVIFIYNDEKVEGKLDIKLEGPNKIINGEEISITGKVKNNTNIGQDAILIIGLYNKNSNELIKYSLCKEYLKVNETSILNSGFLVPEEGEYYIKAFIWDNLENQNILEEEYLYIN